MPRVHHHTTIIMYRVLWHESAYYCTIRAAVLCACISRTHMHVFKLRALPSVCVHVLGACAVRALFTKPKHAPTLFVAVTCAHMCVHFVNGVCTFAIRNVPLIKAASCVRLDAKSPQSADAPLKTWSSPDQHRRNLSHAAPGGATEAPCCTRHCPLQAGQRASWSGSYLRPLYRKEAFYSRQSNFL